jgi:hypothetical protein
MSRIRVLWLLALTELAIGHVSLDSLNNGVCGVYQPEKHSLQSTCFGQDIQNQILLPSTEIKNSTLDDEPFLPSRYPLASPSPHWTSPPKCIDRGNETNVYCVFTSTTFAHGRGISIFTTPENAAAMAQLPAFQDASVHDDTPAFTLAAAAPTYSLRALPGRGIGAIATRTLHRGDRILSESPSFMLDDDVAADVDDGLRHLLQRHAIEGLPAPLRHASMGTLGHFGVGDPIDDIIATNAFSVEMFNDGRPPGGADEYDVGTSSFNSLLPAISVRWALFNPPNLS